MKYSIYLSARYSLVREMVDHAEMLEALGHRVTSTWFNLPPTDEQLEQRDKTAFNNQFSLDVEKWDDRSLMEIREVMRSNMIICFTPGGSRGGKHVEFGMVLGKRIETMDESMRLVVVGPRENIFHANRLVEQYDTFDDFLAKLDKEEDREAALRRG